MGLSTLAVKVMGKYITSAFKTTMEFSTRYLVLCNHINLSGCSQFKQFKQVETRSKLDLVSVYMI